MVSFKNVFILSSFIILTFVFQNCGPQVNFKAAASQNETPAAPAPSAQSSGTRGPAVAASPPPPPLTLLQKAELLCPTTKAQASVTWKRIDWLKPSFDVASLPPCLIKEYTSLYSVEKCSNTGFTSVGANINSGNSMFFEAANKLTDFSFPSSGGSLYANISNIGNFSMKSSANLELNTLQLDTINMAVGVSCIHTNSGNRIISDAFTSSSSSKLALFGINVDGVKAKVNFLHMKSPGNGTHEVYIINSNIDVMKVESPYISLNLKNAIITNLCTTDNAIIKAAEESGVANYISDLTDPRCNP